MRHEPTSIGAKTRRASQRRSWALALTVMIGVLGAAPCRAEDGAALLYRRYCAACHGLQGHGDGPAARALQPPPPDLTELEADIPELMRAIDGRRTIHAHGSGSMPVWGEVFEQSHEGEPHKRQTTLRQVEALADYVFRLRHIPRRSSVE